MDCVMLAAVASQSLGYQGRGDFAFEADGASGAASSRRSCLSPSPACRLPIPDSLDHSPDAVCLAQRGLDRAIAAGRAFGLRMEGTWMHVGTPNALAQAEQRLTLARQR